jgi:hypothetical protein
MPLFRKKPYEELNTISENNNIPKIIINSNNKIISFNLDN